MPLADLDTVTAIVAFVFAFFILFLGLRVRSVLVDQPYRTRALWTAIGALALAGFIVSRTVDSVFGNPPTTFEGILVEDSAWGLTFIALYGWIASNINVTISADFFNRDALSWKKGGWLVALLMILVLYVFASLPSWWIPAVTDSTLVEDIFSSLFLVAVAYATLVLFLSYRRISDQRIKTYTRWVVVSVAALFVALFASGTGLDIIPGALWMYSEYRTVGSLAIKSRVLPT